MNPMDGLTSFCKGSSPLLPLPPTEILPVQNVVMMMSSLCSSTPMPCSSPRYVPRRLICMNHISGLPALWLLFGLSH